MVIRIGFCLISVLLSFATARDDRQVLMDLYQATGGESWTYTGGWNTESSFCTWDGVTCVDDDKERVFALHLGLNNMVGKLPASIGNLTDLYWLTLDHNEITGPIPSSIGNLKKLAHLELSNNKFNGEIPSSIGKLAKLEDFLANDNQLSGSIPNSITALKNLVTLDLSNNNLEDLPPKFATYCSQLTHCNLTDNPFTCPVDSVVADKCSATCSEIRKIS